MSDDPLEDFLKADFSSPDQSPLRQRLLMETTRRLRRRRRLRQLALIGSWAASFAAGALVVFFWPASQASRPDLEEHVQEKPAPPQVARVEEMPAPALVPDPLTKEWQAFDSVQNRAALYFEAGNSYLAEENDLASALRCYRQALDLCSVEQLAVHPDDNWLLATLKESRLKEKNNVQ